MRAAVLLVLACCDAPELALDAAAASAEVAEPARAEIELPLIDPAWRTGGAVDFAGGSMSLRFCCVSWGVAITESPTLAAGRWRMSIDHSNTECTESTLGLVTDLSDQTLLATVPMSASSTPSVSVVDLDLAAPAPIGIQFGTNGGKECCGTTKIASIRLAPR